MLFENLSLTVDGPAVLWAPSGWGKTTLLRILMGLETPDAGRITSVGRVSAVFQEDRLCPQLTAEENVALVLATEKYLPGNSPADRNAVSLCCAPSGLRATPCCWMSPSPAWTRRQ